MGWPCCLTVSTCISGDARSHSTHRPHPTCAWRHASGPEFPATSLWELLDSDCLQEATPHSPAMARLLWTKGRPSVHCQFRRRGLHVPRWVPPVAGRESHVSGWVPMDRTSGGWLIAFRLLDAMSE